MMYRFQIQKYILSEVFRVYEPQEPLTFEPYLHVGMTFKNFNNFLNKKVSSRPYVEGAFLVCISSNCEVTVTLTPAQNPDLRC